MTEIEAIRFQEAFYMTATSEKGKEACRMAISALKEIQKYREMGRKLREAYGDCEGLLENAVSLLCDHEGVDVGNPIKARLLTDEDVDKWEAYKSIGTVEECREAVEKQKPKKPEIIDQDFDYYKCPVCGEYIWATDNINDHKYCLNCGQAIQWENLEGMEDE